MIYEAKMMDDGRWFISRTETRGGVANTEALPGDYDSEEDALAEIKRIAGQ